MGGRWRQLINQLIQDCHDNENEHFNDDNDNNEDGDAKEETDNEDEDANQERGCCQLADPLISPSLLIEATIHLVQELYTIHWPILTAETFPQFSNFATIKFASACRS